MAALDMPQDMPDISMPELEDEDIDQYDEITLAEAIREARRRKRIRRLQPASARQNTKSKTFKETHNLKSGRIWCIGTQNVENGYKRAFFARLGEGLKKN
jgi:hypothetical protein